MTQQKKITELQPGDSVVAFFILRKKEIKTGRESGKDFLALEFGDASGRISGTLWEEVHDKFNALALGDIVKVKGQVTRYKDQLQLNVDKIRQTQEGDEFDITQLVPVVEKDRAQLWAHLEELIASIQHPHLKELLNVVFSDNEIRQKFGDAPGGKLWHHNYLGGLLEHTLAVTDISDRIGQMYPTIHRDLLVTAGLLHDIGKIDSYTYKTLIDFTDEGRLVGHIVMGAQMVSDKIKTISGFPKKLETELLHLILSHQGKLEQASPVVPMTLEGMILYYADEIDSKANAFLRVMKKEKRAGVKWSSFIQLLNRFLYFGSADEEG